MSTSTRVRRGYCDTAAGQIHYRECGSGRPVVLGHWAPSSGRMYEHVLPRFAARGYRAIAFDLAGYGRSDKFDAGWSIADYAHNWGEAMRAIDASPAAVVGGHLTAAIATELAIESPSAVSKLVLDGSPAWTLEQRAGLFARFGGLSPAITASGTHKTFAWDMMERSLREFDDRFEVTAETLPLVYSWLVDFYETDLVAKPALFQYTMLDRLASIRVPTLALTAVTEALRFTHPAVMAGVPGVVEHVFPGAHPLFDAARTDEYVDAIHRFIA